MLVEVSAEGDPPRCLFQLCLLHCIEARPGEFPVDEVRLDLGSRQIKESRELSPADPTGVTLPVWLRITPDGSAVAYNILRVRSHLFVMRGVGVAKN